MFSSAPISIATLALTQDGFNTDEANAWTSAYPHTATADLIDRARAWRVVGMGGIDAAAWDRAGWTNPQTAVLWFLLGFTLRGANFVRSRIPAGSAQAWLGSGLSASEMVTCIGAGCTTVRSALALAKEIEDGDLDRGAVHLQAAMNGIDVRQLL